jgi:hypothetical protein
VLQTVEGTKCSMRSHSHPQQPHSHSPFQHHHHRCGPSPPSPSTQELTRRSRRYLQGSQGPTIDVSAPELLASAPTVPAPAVHTEPPLLCPSSFQDQASPPHDINNSTSTPSALTVPEECAVGSLTGTHTWVPDHSAAPAAAENTDAGTPIPTAGTVVPAVDVPGGVFSLGKRDLLRQAWNELRLALPTGCPYMGLRRVAFIDAPESDTQAWLSSCPEHKQARPPTAVVCLRLSWMRAEVLVNDRVLHSKQMTSSEIMSPWLIATPKFSSEAYHVLVANVITEIQHDYVIASMRAAGMLSKGSRWRCS